MIQNILKRNRHNLILLFDFISAEMNEFILVICGECHFSYAQSMCKVLTLSAVCGVRAIVVHTLHLVTLEVSWVLVDLWYSLCNYSYNEWKHLSNNQQRSRAAHSLTVYCIFIVKYIQLCYKKFLNIANHIIINF